jgi:release factor glutamine methyltransferase
VTAAEALRVAEEQLAAAGIDTPSVDAEWLMAHALGVSRSDVRVQRERDVPEVFFTLLERRRSREPLAYVLGEWGFRRLTLKTDLRALVPRPETEVVVERALASIAGLGAPRVLDVGVGGGAIALAIADEHPGARVTGVDKSPSALELARENATQLGLDVDLRLGGSEAAAEGWDLVVSNPPYIPQATLPSLQSELDWEPREALVEAALYEEIVDRAKTRSLVFEVGYDQADRVSDLLESAGYTEIGITADLSGMPRVVEGRRS